MIFPALSAGFWRDWRGFRLLVIGRCFPMGCHTSTLIRPQSPTVRDVHAVHVNMSDAEHLRTVRFEDVLGIKC